MLLDLHVLYLLSCWTESYVEMFILSQQYSNNLQYIIRPYMIEFCFPLD